MKENWMASKANWIRDRSRKILFSLLVKNAEIAMCRFHELSIVQLLVVNNSHTTAQLL